jgi:tRNA G18 (ribose-2'-O)-methylase SpoU
LAIFGAWIMWEFMLENVNLPTLPLRRECATTTSTPPGGPINIRALDAINKVAQRYSNSPFTVIESLSKVKLMAFSEKKFLELPQNTQAKKCSDLLRDLVSSPGKDWKSKAHLYNQYVLWAQNPNRQIQTQILNIEELLSHYKFWRTQSGLGFESQIIKQLAHTDQSEPLAEAIHWKVWMHNLRSAHNVGSIIRTVDCFGWQSVITSGYTAPSTHKGVSSAALGAEQWIECESFEDSDLVLEKYTHLPLIALELTEDAVEIQNFEWPTQGILLLGNEEFGVNSELLKKCVATVKIPQYGRKGSLNVANAFAVAAFAARNYFLKN